MTYPSRKIRRIRACTHQRPQRNEAQYAVSRRCQYASITEYGVCTSIGYDVSNLLSNTTYSIQLINMVYPLPLDTAYRSSVTEAEPKRHFKTQSLDELRSPDFNLLSDQEYSEEEIAETMAETMEQYMSKTRADYGS
ncbi:hypothetical protein Tco_0251317 [Tanacetum coccineum]